jgi:hypothetical protein
MVAYLTRMPAGIPGEPNRGFTNVIKPEALTPLGTTGHPTAYGIPVVIDQTAGNVGRIRQMAVADAVAAVYGILVRPFPGNSSTDALGVSTPPNEGSCDVMRFGYVEVLLSGNTPAVKGGQVYVWNVAATGTHIVGGFEATDPTTSGFALPGARFQGPADASGNTEISVNFGA